MPRKLRPCGTPAAYARHLNRGEKPCADCRAANAATKSGSGDAALRVGEIAMARALDANPPVIVWRKNNRGVSYAVSVYDPHADTGANKDKTECQYGHPFDEENTLIKSDGTRQCRQCRNRWNADRRTRKGNETLMTAARTEI